MRCLSNRNNLNLCCYPCAYSLCDLVRGGYLGVGDLDVKYLGDEGVDKILG